MLRRARCISKVFNDICILTAHEQKVENLCWQEGLVDVEESISFELFHCREQKERIQSI